jgi:two-component system response regulator TctD
MTEPQRILVIEDDADLAVAIQRSLELNGFAVTVARDGGEGLRLQRQRPFEIVVTDIFMPETDGVEVITRLSREFPGTKIVAMSGRPERRRIDYLQFAHQFGADRVLQKPFNLDELISAVRELG